MNRPLNDKDPLVVIFDGLCNLCSGVVQFIIKHDKKKEFRFASLQSPFGQEILQENNLSTTDLHSFILLEQGNIYTKSTGALRVAKRLNGLWPLLYCFIIVPKFIRDAVYAWISKNRFRWFGKKDACWLPTPDLRARFVS